MISRLKNAQGLFNLHHTQAWNIVECIFGIYKHHFGVVEAAPEYSPKIQAIFIAVFRGVAIESWINNAGTWGATSSASSSRTPQEPNHMVIKQLGIDNSAAEQRRVLDCRDKVTARMWDDYQKILEEIGHKWLILNEWPSVS